MVDVLLAGILGAAVLAITLLHKKQQRQAKQLDQLHAEVTAQKIAALQQLTPTALVAPEAAPDAPPEPAHRKRHLALYIGGGVAAVLASLGERIRSLTLRRPRGVTTAATAITLAAASTAAAFYVTSGSGHNTPVPGGSSTPSATAPEHPNSEATSTALAASPSASPSVPPTASPRTADTPGTSPASQRPQRSFTSGRPLTPTPTETTPGASTTHAPTPTAQPSTRPPAPSAPTPSTPTVQPSTTPPGSSDPTPTPTATSTPSPDNPDDCLCVWFPWLPQCTG